MNTHLPIGDIHIFLCSFLFHRMSKLFIPFPFLLCNYMRLSSARHMHTNPSIPVIPPAVKAPDTRGQKGIDFLDFLDSKGVRFPDVADGKMTLDEFMDILTLDDCINLLGGQPNTGCACQKER